MSTKFNVRKEYGIRNLDRNDLDINPFDQFGKWISEAIQSHIDEPNAMVLSTIGLQNRPSSRIVLLKDYTSDGFTFFTNFNSKKGRQLNINPYASLLFAWHQMERQIRIEGKVEKLSPAESDAYFETRPEGSKLGAWISPQSEEISSREFLETKNEEIREKFQNKTITRPQNWGGYKLIPDLFEFWQGRENRLHDRFEYFLENTNWNIRRLAP
jgi:pyridoxamine 5'-phosphate oxidase